MKTRSEIEAEIGELEQKLLFESDEHTSKKSIAHCDLQIRFWRLCQALASMDTRTSRSDASKQKAFQRTQKAAEQASTWETRKSVALKNKISADLDWWRDELAQNKKTAAVLEEIAT